VVVQGVNIVTKHVKPSRENPQGGIQKREAPIHISNVMLADPETGDPTRVRFKTLESGTQGPQSRSSRASRSTSKRRSVMAKAARAGGGAPTKKKKDRGLRVQVPEGPGRARQRDTSYSPRLLARYNDNVRPALSKEFGTRTPSPSRGSRRS
jgi:ribosomal protein L24